MKKAVLYLAAVLLFYVLTFQSVWSDRQWSNNEHTKMAITSNPILLLSTLDGSLLGVDKNSGMLIWTLQEDPVLVQSVDHGSDGFKFLPNPKDGSLYALNQDRDQLERLPLTIPELAQITPAKGSDGLLYTARKSDMWLVINPRTGSKLYSMTHAGITSYTCPVTDADDEALYIARTAYTVTVFDGHSKEVRWNTTYWEYSSRSYPDYLTHDLLHFTSSSDGKVLSVDALTGQQKWQQSFNSPVISIYDFEGGSLRKLHAVTVASEMLSSLTVSSVLAIQADISSIRASDSALQSSLFIGSQNGHLYAVDSLTKEGSIKMEFSLLQPPDIPLLEGPHQDPLPEHVDIEDTKLISELGHFCVPEGASIKLTPLQRQIRDAFGSINYPTHAAMSVSEQSSVKQSPVIEIKDSSDTELIPAVPSQFTHVRDVLFLAVTVITSSIVAAVIALVINHKNSRGQDLVHVDSTSQNDDASTSNVSSHAPSNISDSHNSSSKATSRESSLVTQGELKVSIGKITYFPSDILGRGSQGTIVFRGTFDKRCVAVKRILPECFNLAETEVQLLRQSDHHPNVIRYFCMEKDSVFSYMALELCQATLRDYVEDWRFNIPMVDDLDILHQAVCGLEFLHSIGIVHRDIKPRNVLLSMPTSNCSIRAMISDFGLCRKLGIGRESFTALSAVAGTEGWIAPELLTEGTRATCAVDVFSMGCIIYYVLTHGQHPFGPPLHRQGNIVSGDFSLAEMSSKQYHVASALVKSMISNNYVFRPSSQEVLCHCLFWSKEKQLAFFQDVSDRVEKEPVHSAIVQSLEQGAHNVVRGDWRHHITEELRDDLKKYRTYQGTSVRDLLRAMRNKKHHYRELSGPLKVSLGDIPEGFLEYFTSRFPLLLVHTYKRLELCKNERMFHAYYA